MKILISILIFLIPFYGHAEWYLIIEKDIKECQYKKQMDQEIYIRTFHYRFKDENPKCEVIDKRAKKLKGIQVICRSNKGAGSIVLYETIYKCNSSLRKLRKALQSP